MARLAGRKILITGGASGIGRATARLCAGEGAAVAVLDRSAEAAQEVAGGIGGHAFVADVADHGSVDAAVEAAATAMGGLDGVVNAAGIFSSEGLTETSAELFNRILTVNLTGTFLVIRAAERFLRAADSASVVNIGSGVGLIPTGPGSTAYVASKGGVIALTRVLAMELAPKIRVNVVCPGMVDTAMTESFLRDNQGGIRSELAARYALGRAAEPEELARAILFLLSEEASFITGIALPVDGGRTYH
ncbi:MAG: SDR family oxidoreductase [Acetobacteraceae bacterium]|nr:SDR family oxidoreductase [Acetobacteraceae bacterium]